MKIPRSFDEFVQWQGLLEGEAARLDMFIHEVWKMKKDDITESSKDDTLPADLQYQALLVERKELFEPENVFNMMREVDGRITELICEDCNQQNGRRTTCPYIEDIHERIEKVVLCSECYKGRCDEI